MEKEFTLKESKVDGVGLFANRNFLGGEIVLNYKDNHFYKKRWDALSDRQIQKSWYYKYDDEFCWICDNVYWFKHINHSRYPNCLWIPNARIIVANRMIFKNKEITIDYRNEERPTRIEWPKWI